MTAALFEPPTRETLPPIACTSWCRDHDGHTREVHPNDQLCASEYVSPVRLTRMPLQTFGNERYLNSLEVYLKRRPEGRTHVHLVRNERADQDVELTLDEA